MQRAFTDFGFDEPAYKDVLGIIGLSLIGAVEKLAPTHLDEAMKEKIALAYSSHYRETENSLRLYPEVIDTLTELKKRGYMMGVVTGKSRRGLIRVMEKFELAQFFPVWRTADCCFSKPHPAMVLESITEMGAKAEETIVIGDSRFDIQMANAAGVRSLGVSFGVETGQVLLDEGAAAVADEFKALLQFFPELSF